jgi:hypothetical protein
MEILRKFWVILKEKTIISKLFRTCFEQHILSVKSYEVEILNHCSRKFFELPFSSKIKVMVSPYSW